MKKIKQALIIVSLILIFNEIPVKACTTFCISDSNNIVFGRNLDFLIGDGHIVVNKRNLKKVALIEPSEKPIKWISKYGSLTFNMMGWELPFGGINEKGLVIEQMGLKESEYPETDERYSLDLLQWIQYQLDNSATVDEVIESDSLIRPSKNAPKKLHFLIADCNGDVATIEYLNGKMVYYKGKELPYPTLANSTYKSSVEYISRFKDFGGKESISCTSESLDRFAITASKIKKYNSENVLDYAFDILDSVSIQKYHNNETYWSIVYDIKNMVVYIKTYDNKSTREIHLSEFNFSCETPNLYADIDEDIEKGKYIFNICSYEANRALIENVCNGIHFLNSIPENERDDLAKYYKTITCDK